MMDEEKDQFRPGPGNDADLRTRRTGSGSVKLKPASGLGSGQAFKPLECAPNFFVVTGFKIGAGDENAGEWPRPR